MVPTTPVIERLSACRFQRLAFWSRAADGVLFRPRIKDFLGDKRPIWLYARRIAPEK